MFPGLHEMAMTNPFESETIKIAFVIVMMLIAFLLSVWTEWTEERHRCGEGDPDEIYY